MPQSCGFMAIGASNTKIWLLGCEYINQPTPTPVTAVSFDIAGETFTEHATTLITTSNFLADWVYGRCYTQINNLIFLPQNGKFASFNVDDETFTNPHWSNVNLPSSTIDQYFGAHMSCFTQYNNRYIIMVGGRTSEYSCNCGIKEVHFYDIEENEWIKGPNMNTRRWLHTCEVSKNYLYAIGGNEDCCDRINNIEKIDIIDIKGINSKSWAYTAQNLPVAVESITSVVVEGIIYVIGNDGSYTVTMIDTNNNDAVSSDTNSAGIDRGNTAAIFKYGYFYIFGGADGIADGNYRSNKWTKSNKVGTSAPSPSPTDAPTAPTPGPTSNTNAPSKVPTSNPTIYPTVDPTVDPTSDPTVDPTTEPTTNPTIDPTMEPTSNPSATPSQDPTVSPSNSPSSSPTLSPVTLKTIEYRITFETQTEITESEVRFILLTVFGSFPNVEIVITDITISDNNHVSIVIFITAPQFLSASSESTAKKKYSDAMEDEMFVSYGQINVDIFEVETVTNTNKPIHEEEINLFNTIVIGIVIIWFLLILTSFIHAKAIKKNDFYALVALITFFLQFMDMIYDILFTIQLTYYQDYERNISNSYFLMMIMSCIFIIVPVFVSFLQLNREIYKWTIDESQGEAATGWLKEYASLLQILAIFSGSSFNALEMVRSNLFSLKIFDIPLSKTQILRFKTKRVYSIILFENIPQLALQGWFLIATGGAPNNIAYVSLSFSFISIIIAITSSLQQKQIIHNQDHIQIGYDVTGSMIVATPRSFQRRVDNLRRSMAAIIGVNESLIEIPKPETCNNGLRISINIYIDPKQNKYVNIDHNKLIKEAASSGQIAMAVKDCWELNTKPNILNVTYQHIDSLKKQKNNTNTRNQLQSNMAQILKQNDEIQMVNMSSINEGQNDNHLVVLPPDVPEVNITNTDINGEDIDSSDD